MRNREDLQSEGTNAVVLPSWTLHAIAVAPGGARPSYAQGNYQRDHAFYTAWDEIARDRDSFRSGVWSESSSSFTCALTAGWVSCSPFAAREKLRST